MSFVAVIIAAVFASQAAAPQDPQPATQQLAPRAEAEQMTPAQQRARARAEAQQICSRRAPTGRRLEQTICLSREMAAAQARFGREEHEKVTLGNGWQIESGN